VPTPADDPLDASPDDPVEQVERRSSDETAISLLQSGLGARKIDPAS
jgi:hypothetical protein